MTNPENTPHRVVRIADDAIVGEAPSLVAAKHLRTQLFGNRVTAYRIEEVPAERNLDGDLADRPTECCAADLAAQGSTVTCGCDACEQLTPETIARKAAEAQAPADRATQAAFKAAGVKL